MIYIFEGIDRVGKDTLIDGVEEKLLDPINHHFSAPPKGMSDLRAQITQRQSYELEWDKIRQALADDRDMVINRFHLGETVYGPRYRTLNSQGVQDIFDDEKYAIDLLHFEADWHKVRLILVTTTSFKHLIDDGGNFNWANKEKEQNDFLISWAKSGLKKKIVDTYNPATNFYRPVKWLVQEVMSDEGWY